MPEQITKERLKSFYESCIYAQKLELQLEDFRKQYNALQAVDLTHTKVINGDAKPHSPQEKYLQTIENKSRKLSVVKSKIDSERIIILQQIQRLKKPEYRDILTERYIQLKGWKQISFEYFGNEKDYWTYRESRYHFIVMTWHKRAVKELEAISKTPFVLNEAEQVALW